MLRFIAATDCGQAKGSHSGKKFFTKYEVTIMRKTLLVYFFAVVFSAVFYHPSIVLSDTLYFDSDGTAIDKTEYEKIASDAEKALSLRLKDGYNAASAGWRDPIKLRQKRIEQWKIMRSSYNPDSIPTKIENPPAKK